mmetsp:Transcript_36430/g.85976  ORF Transcript_36430/g.85976 Transcript_36430/m.85976 type:complete len:268 (-) Transcript_36430:372-1175(-)
MHRSLAQTPRLMAPLKASFFSGGPPGTIGSADADAACDASCAACAALSSSRAAASCFWSERRMRAGMSPLTPSSSAREACASFVAAASTSALATLCGCPCPFCFFAQPALSQPPSTQPPSATSPPPPSALPQPPSSSPHPPPPHPPPQQPSPPTGVASARFSGLMLRLWPRAVWTVQRPFVAALAASVTTACAPLSSALLSECRRTTAPGWSVVSEESEGAPLLPRSVSTSVSQCLNASSRTCMKALVDLHTMEWRESPTMKPWQPS